jgi:hypothetical protein
MLLDPSPEKVALRRRKLEALLTPQQGTFKLPGGRSPDDLPPCSSATDPRSAADPEQTFSLNKKERTSETLAALPTAKQKTCPHPPTEIVFLSDNIIVCHHCWGLLDESLTLQTAGKLPEERGAGEMRALPECESVPLADEPEAMQPPEAVRASAAA